MGNSLRCCLACVLPCGALDLIRIVHLNGFVEEITRRQITAAEILQAYPNHVLSKPCSQGMVRKILILSSDSQLKRGSIYFLIPDSSLPSDPSSFPKNKNHNNKQQINTVQKLTNHHDNNDKVDDDDVDHGNDDTKIMKLDLSTLDITNNNNNNNNNNNENNVVVSCETIKLKSKYKSGKHQRRRSSRGKSGIWQPHLECISEDF